ncbi:MAG TPA: alpha/beta fold hydrolase [Candidatus Acidoferrales bacterium]|nr:alpha/beta fold hydrolase [Candidatus Acidoferrales bacterium]
MSAPSARPRAALVTVLALAAACATAAAPPGDPRDPRGVWQGRLQGVLRIVLHVSADSSGTRTGSLDSPDQGAAGLPASRVGFEHDTLRFELARPAAAFVGRMNESGTMLRGDWLQGGRTLPLELARADSLPPLRRPQLPRKPYPYDEEDVRYPGGEPGIELAGTLSHPRGAGPFPCALLITGSGPQDRDETIAGHKPFLVIADRLTRAGMAVLRVDDRGVGGSSGPLEGSTTAALAGDVRAGVRYLRGRRDIDPRRIGLIGHSEGGLIAAMVAAGSDEVEFIVLLAGPGVRGDSLLIAQAAAIGRAAGASEADVAAERDLQAGLFALARQHPDSATTVARVRAIFRAAGIDSARAESRLGAAVAGARSPWIAFFIDADPAPVLRRVRCPVLALNGGRDLQVLPAQNLPAIASALAAGGNPDVTTRELPGLNHLFQSCTTGLPTEYAQIEETFSPAALETLTVWITRRTAGAR